jgi:predicted  nucleic acid-binding Zn-ribbon protein
MSETDRNSLEELQGLDQRMDEVRQRIAEFEPLLAEVEEPVLVLEGEVTTTRSRLQEMKLEERRLELSADEKRVRLKQLQERLLSVRNIREEAAVQTESDMLQRALEADEQEALTLLDQIRKLEDRLEEAETALEEAQASLEPRRRELLEGQEQALAELSNLTEGREAYSSQVKTDDLRVYEAIKAGGRSIAVSSLTADGACGHCFNMIPLQTRAEISNGAEMIRCEVCGVILTPPGPELPEAPAPQHEAPGADAEESQVSPDAVAETALEESQVSPHAVAETALEESQVSPDAVAETALEESQGDASSEKEEPLG